MEFLPQQNRRNQGDAIPEGEAITASGRDVVIIGGGDTGADCTGTSNRQGAASVTQFELLPQPPDLGPFPRRGERPSHTPWPQWPAMLRTSTSHEEGCRREWSLLTKRFDGDAEGRVTGLTTVDLEWYADAAGRQAFREIEGTERHWPAQLVLLAMGFVGPEKGGLIDSLGVELDARGNVRCGPDYRTSVPGVYAAGDMRRGQSLVVWAIHEGREAARAIDLALMGETRLPTAVGG